MTEKAVGDTRAFPSRPIVGVGTVVLRDMAVLLIRRGRAPNRGVWSLPGGAQELGETAEAAARRELSEETGLVVGAMHLAATVDSIDRAPDGRVQYHFTIIDFVAAYSGGDARAGGDADGLAWVSHAALDDYGVWPEAKRVINLGRRVLDAAL